MKKSNKYIQNAELCRLCKSSAAVMLRLRGSRIEVMQNQFCLVLYKKSAHSLHRWHKWRFVCDPVVRW